MFNDAVRVDVINMNTHPAVGVLWLPSLGAPLLKGLTVRPVEFNFTEAPGDWSFLTGHPSGLSGAV